MASILKDEYVNGLKEAFLQHAQISKQKVCSIIKHMGHTLPEDEVLELVNSMDKYNGTFAFKTFLKITAKLNMREAFREFDKDGNGYITIEEFAELMKASSDEQVSFQEVIRMMNDYDESGDGMISYEEFVTMLISDEKSKTQLMEEAFQEFDINGDGFIYPEDLKDVFSRVGENYTDDEIKKMVGEADFDGDGRISFEEFVSSIDWSS